MANEIKYLHDDGAETVYAIIRHMDGKFYDTVAPAWDVFIAADWADYDIAMPEVGAGGGAGVNVALQGTFPAAIVAGYYWVDFYVQAGGAAASTDSILKSILYFWDATSLLPSEAGTGMLLSFSDSMVYADADTGTDSTVWPYGTVTYPTSTIANAETIAVANSLDTIHCHGALSLAAAMEHYNFIGDGHIDVTDTFDVNSQSVEHSAFVNIIVTGIGANATGVGNQTTYAKCLIYAHTNIHGYTLDSGFGSACSILNGGYLHAVDCVFGVAAVCTLTLNTPAYCRIINARGELTLAGMAGGTANISLQNGAVLTVNNTCVGGAINVTGDGTVIDNSAGGCTVTVTRAVATIAAGGIVAASFAADALINTTFATSFYTAIESEVNDALTAWGSPTQAAIDALHVATDADIAAVAALILAVDTVVDAISVDTGELQTDWTNGGRLDLLLDLIKARTDTIGSVTVEVTSPVAQSGEVTIYGSDDYLIADGRALVWTITGTVVALLTDATIVLRILGVASYRGSIKVAESEYDAELTIDGDEATVDVELTAADTAALAPAPPADVRAYVYQLIATTDVDDSIITLAQGRMTVNKGMEEPTPA